VNTRSSIVAFVLGAALLAPLSSTHPLRAQQPPNTPAAQQPGQVPPPQADVPGADSTKAPTGQQTSPETEIQKEEAGFMGAADRAMGAINNVIGAFLFFDVMFWDDQRTVPFIVLWLVIGAAFLTLRMGFINFRAFGHAIAVTRGKYTNASDPGDVSHFQALTTALSATVGLGNIAGVAIAVSTGGPGATFWMIIAGLLGMTSKFTECTLAQIYRETRSDGKVLGGPMQYLSKGLAKRGNAGLGKVLAVMFAILCIGGSFGGGNSFQVNQSLNAMQETFPALAGSPWIYGLGITFLTAIVILGGIKRIAQVAEMIVPVMCLSFIVGALTILGMNLESVPSALAAIFTQAFSPDAVYGGVIGAMVVGFQRAAFSNEAGAGSAAIAHSAAKTEYPVREGIVALLEPFIDTVVVCTMTALVIVVTGAYNNPAYADLIANSKGAALTSRAMGEYISWFPYVLSAIVFMFAFSTMISWSYYGERCWVWLFGDKASVWYRVLFLVFAFGGSIITSANVLNFGDLMILGMAFPNLIGVFLMHREVKDHLDAYWGRLKSGQMVRR
jgi:AGCS family alanine or glycine:cation symporter